MRLLQPIARLTYILFMSTAAPFCSRLLSSVLLAGLLLRASAQ
jgi:hypothetical protein